MIIQKQLNWDIADMSTQGRTSQAFWISFEKMRNVRHSHSVVCEKPGFNKTLSHLMCKNLHSFSYLVPKVVKAEVVGVDYIGKKRTTRTE